MPMCYTLTKTTKTTRNVSTIVMARLTCFETRFHCFVSLFFSPFVYLFKIKKEMEGFLLFFLLLADILKMASAPKILANIK